VGGVAGAAPSPRLVLGQKALSVHAVREASVIWYICVCVCVCVCMCVCPHSALGEHDVVFLFLSCYVCVCVCS